jgi:hypothetical protein
MKLHHKVDVAPRRAADYPAVGDALDAIMKGFAALMEQGIALPAETEAWVHACQAVKTTHPKRE